MSVLARLFSYVVARDAGFAPNPFYGVCTLATCKPRIRDSAEVGDWVVGTGSAQEKRVGHIVYAMQVSEVLSFDDYWADSRFQVKKPHLHGGLKQAFGDNIYSRDAETGSWQQADSHHSRPCGVPGKANIKRDTSSDRVLVSGDFIYWGNGSILLPQFSGESIIHSTQGHRNKFRPEIVAEFVAWFYSFGEVGCIGDPYLWDTPAFGRRLL